MSERYQIDYSLLAEFSGGGQGKAPKPPVKIQGSQHIQREIHKQSYPKPMPKPVPRPK